MNVNITGRHLKMDDDIRTYAEEKIHKAETFFDRIIEAHMVLSAEKHRRIAEVTLNAKGVAFHAREETENIFASIDSVMEKVDSQIRRYKEKLKDRKHQSVVEVSESESEPEEEPLIVKVHKFPSKPMTVQEAVDQIMESGYGFLMFSNSQTDQVNVVYRRKNGNYGLIEPDFE